ncbi:hypothetical protein OWR28_02485 [Chryseobacterium sp. 1B4]
MENQKTGVELIAEERQKQIGKHGFTAQHSIEHPEWYDKEQLAYAAHSLLSLEGKPAMYIKEPDNWDKEWFIRILKKHQLIKITGTE